MIPVLIVGGFSLVGFVVYLTLAGAVVIQVPDGEEPIPYFQRWKQLRWTTRLGKVRLFLVCLGIGMIVGGFIVWILAVAAAVPR